MDRKPIKKIKSILSDIHHPKQGNDTPIAQKQDFFKRGDWEESKNFNNRPSLNVSRLINFFKVAILAFGISILAYFGYLFLGRHESLDAAKAIYNDLRRVGGSLRNLDTDSVPALLQNIDTNLLSLEEKARPLSLAPLLNDIPSAISEVGNISRTLSSVNSRLAALKSEGFAALFNDGPKFTGFLKSLAADFSKLEISIKNLRNNAAGLNIIPPKADEEYISFATDLQRSRETLEALLGVIDRPGENHFLILFENPAEIRPGGGLFGSYGDLVIQAGQIRSIETQDIYYPESSGTYKIIPPSELQNIITKWGPQNANWFFDFPTSARKVSDFIEESSLYKDRAIKFEGVIAINVKLIEDILKITGAIDIPDYRLTLTSENFIAELQKEAETGKSKKPGQNSRKILKYATPVLLERLGGLGDEDKARLLDAIKRGYVRKDIKLFFEDSILQGLVTRYGGAGEVYRLPADFKGDYLAVVNANIGGEKSDRFMKQKIELKSQIDPLGVITDDIVITRTHTGQNQKDSWYRAINQNFMKIFVPPTSRLETFKGNSVKAAKTPLNYAKFGYNTDPDLGAVEKTKELRPELNASVYRENGKNVFGFWLNIAPGKTGTVTGRYSNSKRFVLVEGAEFQFIFDKQSGVESDLSYTVEAPTGFRWRESKSPTFNYMNSELPSRIIINLTLEKDEV